jgi:ABC-type transport system involved in cytochrome c biogenesis permease subunit
VADDIIYRATAFGLGMLTLGLFIGVAWQRGYHPEYVPLRDPKVLFSLATWVTFMLYLASRLWLGWQGRRTNLVVVYGFVLLVISFFGAPHVLTGVAR